MNTNDRSLTGVFYWRERLLEKKRRFIRRDRSPDHQPGDRLTRAVVQAIINPAEAHEYARRILEEAENAPQVEAPEPIVHTWAVGDQSEEPDDDVSAWVEKFKQAVDEREYVHERLDRLANITRQIYDIVDPYHGMGLSRSQLKRVTALTDQAFSEGLI